MDIHALVVENNHDSIEVLRRVLQREGAHCTCYEKAEDVDPDILNSVDIVFLDLDLPGMDGYEIYELLRNQYNMQVPIVAYTVNTNEKATTRKMGFNGMFAKPLDMNCFKENFPRLLEGQYFWEDC